MIADRMMAFLLDLAFVHVLSTAWIDLLRDQMIRDIPSVEFDNPFLLWAQSGFHFFLAALIWFLYFFGFATIFSETPGMAIFGLRIQRISGKTASLGWRRGLLRTMGILLGALTLGLGMVPAFFSPSGRALHDCLSDTMVVRSRLGDLPEMEGSLGG